MSDVYLGRLPILDKKQNVVAYELLFRSDQQNKAVVADNSTATAKVITETYGQLGIENVIGKRRGFIKVDAPLLMHDSILLLPKKHVVLEILRSVEITEAITLRCAFLKQKGYQLALSYVDQSNSHFDHILSLVNIVKINVNDLTTEHLMAVMKHLSQWSMLLLAEKVESRETADRCIALNFHMLQGFYFTKPEVISGKKLILRSFHY